MWHCGEAGVLAQAPTSRPDQAARLRELVSRRVAPQHRTLTVAVLSGKGGVGKTNIAVNLAICLSGRGLRVALLDADLGLANADLLLDVALTQNLWHVAAGQRSIEEVGRVVAGGVFFVPGASGIEQAADLPDLQRQHLLEELSRLAAQTDVMVLDCGAGISRNVLTMAGAADISLLITTPEPTALTDAYAVVKSLACRRSGAGSVHLVVNLARSGEEARRTFERLARVSERFIKFPIADGGFLLQDTHVELAVRQRCPFVIRYPRCAASACISAIASRLAGTRGVARRSGNFFGRVVGVFV